MIIQRVFLNLSLAFVWCLLHDELSLRQFITGYLIGAGISFFFYRMLHEEHHYLRRIALGRKLALSRKIALSLILLAYFFKEIAVANWAVVKLVLSPRLSVRSGILAYPLELRDDLLITLLANMITLTPGTLSVDVTPDRRFLFIHYLDITDIEHEKQKIKNGFERYLQRIAQ